MEMQNFTPDKQQVLEFTIYYSIEEKCKIEFNPRVGNQSKTQEIVRVSRKFYETVRQEISEIYKFYRDVQLDHQDRAVSTTVLLQPASNLLEHIQGTTTIEKLETIGKEIYQNLFPDRLKKYLTNSSIIILSSKMYPIPFELMHDGETFLATKHLFYRKPMLDQPRKVNISVKAKERPHQVVFFTNPTGDLPAAERETNKIISFFKKEIPANIKLEVVNYQREGACYGVLKGIFFSDRLDIFHYSGHSFIDGEDISFYLQEDSFSVIDLALQYPALFFLNMCESDITQEEKIDFYGYKQLNFPLAIMERGAKACIATLWPIIDETAAKFAIHFYRRILKGDSFGEAVRSSKIELSKKSDSDDITWMSFVLYGDPNNSNLIIQSPPISSKTELENKPLKAQEAMEILLERIKTDPKIYEEFIKNLAPDDLQTEEQISGVPVELNSPQEEVEDSEPQEEVEDSEPQEEVEDSKPQEEVEDSEPQEEVEDSEPQQKINYIRKSSLFNFIRSRNSLRISDRDELLDFMNKKIEDAVQFLIVLLKHSKHATIGEGDINLLYSFWVIPKNKAINDLESYHSQYLYINKLWSILIDDNNNKIRIYRNCVGLLYKFFDDLIELSVDIIIEALPRTKKGDLKRVTINKEILDLAEERLKNRMHNE